MEVLSPNSHSSQNLCLQTAYPIEGDDLELRHIEYGEFKSHDEVIPLESQIRYQTSHINQPSVVRNAVTEQNRASESSLRAVSPQSLRRSPQIAKKSPNTASELVNLPISSNTTPLVSTLFKPNEELLTLLEECRVLLEDLESLENTALIGASEQVKRVGFELRLIGNHKTLPQYDIYTDLNVRFFNLSTKVQLLKSKPEEFITEYVELSPEETGLIKTKNRQARQDVELVRPTPGYLNSKLARRAMRVAQTIRNATKPKINQFQSLNGIHADKPANRFGTAVVSVMNQLKIGFCVTSVCILFAVLYSFLARNSGN